MRALHAGGRPADALNHYAAVRGRLAEELGIDPGAELHAVYRAVLNGDAGNRRAGEHEHDDLADPVPTQLPPDVPAFCSRVAEIEQLDAVLLRRAQRPTAPVIAVISGMAGVGKPNLENWHTSNVTH